MAVEPKFIRFRWYWPPSWHWHCWHFKRGPGGKFETDEVVSHNGLVRSVCHVSECCQCGATSLHPEYDGDGVWG